MAKWLDKNLFWLQMVLLLVILVCFSFGIRGKANLAVAFSVAAFLALTSVIAAKYKKMNLPEDRRSRLQGRGKRFRVARRAAATGAGHED